MRLWGSRLGCTDVLYPFLTSVYCPFNLLQSFKDTTFIKVKRIASSCKICSVHTGDVSVSVLACMRPWIRMHAYLKRSQRCPKCAMAGPVTNIPPANTTRKQAWEKGKTPKELCMRHLDPRKCSCVRVWDPRKLHVSVYKNAPTIVSWWLSSFKGLYDTHTHYTLCSFHVIHTRKTLCACIKKHVYNLRKQWLAYFSYTEMLIRLRVLHDDEICFTFYGRHL